ncbi:hypothetical protein E1A91_A10G214100v1 [Gossypium mustelinum]|uniref:3-oxo-5-alpha-steroid 4-dehydrogenase C-terminal domain-containing protein n=1 Tax=Gossypium mustelinum TaxID=34275 RepID=A0A5D2XPK5_GOSMU|nr:hypothetical protein E1A91_A10G214100v1 [Gossypium mustelinum]
MAIPMVLEIVFPPSLVLIAASVLSLLSLTILGVLETREIHLKYSKFFNASTSSSSSISFKVPSRVGMLLIYTPAFLVGVASFWLFPDGDFRFLLLKSAITIHFFKRILEVIFIHNYSGGICGNFYHHCILSKLRTKGGKEYKIPKGGLFELVICPHYLFEILGFLGISLISQTLYSFSTTLGIAVYLMCRGYVTRKWYMSKFEDLPKEVKAVIPYVF